MSWGAGDFGGGLASRRAPVFGVVIGSQLVGLVLALVLALARGETAPAPVDVGWAVLAGGIGSIGITALYTGLASGRMALVAPLAGVLAAGIPVAAGILLQGPPRELRGIGMAVGLAAVVLLGRGHAGAGPDRRATGLAIAAGAGFGLFALLITRVGPGHVFGSLVAARAASSVALSLAVAARRWPWRPPSRVLPQVGGAGVLDMAGNGFFILAAQAGRLDVAALLSSLYPVTTIALAATVLHERVSRSQAVGIAAAGVAIALIAGG